MRSWQGQEIAERILTFVVTGAGIAGLKGAKLALIARS